MLTVTTKRGYPHRHRDGWDQIITNGYIPKQEKRQMLSVQEYNEERSSLMTLLAVIDATEGALNDMTSRRPKRDLVENLTQLLWGCRQLGFGDDFEDLNYNLKDIKSALKDRREMTRDDLSKPLR